MIGVHVEVKRNLNNVAEDEFPIGSIVYIYKIRDHSWFKKYIGKVGEIKLIHLGRNMIDILIDDEKGLLAFFKDELIRVS